MGLAAAAHAELAEPAARLRLRGRRSRRLPHDAGDHRLHRALCRCDFGPGPDPHQRDLGAPQRRRLQGHHQPGRLALPDRRARNRRVQHPAGPSGRRGGAVGDRHAHADAVPQSGSARGRGRARRRRLGHRHADRRRDPPLGPTRDPRGGRARPRAARLSGQGHPVVDGRRRGARRALRRGRRYRQSSQRAVAATGGLPRAPDGRSQRADRASA